MNKLTLNLFVVSIATLLYIVVIELLGAWSLLTLNTKLENISNKYYFLIQGFIQFIVILLFIYLYRGNSFNDLLKKTNPKWYLFAFLSGISFIYIQTPLNWIYNYFFNTDYYVVYNWIDISRLSSINMVASILLIPVGEELFFRAYVQRKLQNSTNYIIAIIFTAILFSLIHAPYTNLFFEEFTQDWHSSYLTFFGGLISGMIYYKSNSIIPSIIFHVFWNLAAYIL